MNSAFIQSFRLFNFVRNAQPSGFNLYAVEYYDVRLLASNTEQSLYCKVYLSGGHVVELYNALSAS